MNLSHAFAAAMPEEILRLQERAAAPTAGRAERRSAAASARSCRSIDSAGERNPSGKASGYDNLALSFAAVHIGTRKVPLRSRQDPGGTQPQDEREVPHAPVGDGSRRACHPPTRSRSGESGMVGER
jgi:hypothetical protein